MALVPQEIASGVYRLAFPMVNVYLVGRPGDAWAIVDTALPFHFEAIREAAAQVYGKDSHPEAIYLTHGHRDHVGAAPALAAFYDVPIYIHKMELPYVTGRSAYPPFDPTTGGPMSVPVRFMQNQLQDLGEYVKMLSDGELPGLSGWQVIETPGHTPGQVAFFRAADKVLLAGDACTTINLNKWTDLLRQTPKIAIPPAPVTPDWVSVRKSARKLAALSPRVLACGHGEPMQGPQVAGKLFAFAEHFIIPLKGRYVSDPAQFDENGITFLPPAPPDPLPKVLAGVTLVAALGYGIWKLDQKTKRP